MKFEQIAAKLAKMGGTKFSVPPSRPLRASVTMLLLLLLPPGVQAGSGGRADLWFTPDQQGQRLFQRGEFAEAAEVFRDPMWQGAAWFRAGEFERAGQAFARRDTAEAHYNQGNAWLMRGKYETAIASYDRALEKRPDWKEASDNRALAIARARMVEQKGGDMGDQMIGADKIVFDKTAKNGGQETEVAGGKALSDQEVQSLWLRRVQTRPADFLKAKFAYQVAMQQEGTK
jgi:Ca-activated chloride channel family protein